MTQPPEKLFLVKHKDLWDSKVPINQKWKKISDDMHSLNYFYTQEQCRFPLEVNFHGDNEDYGGPRRDFLDLMLKSTEEKLVSVAEGIVDSNLNISP